MKIVIENLPHLNNYLERVERKLQKRPECTAAKLKKIQSVVKHHLNVFDGLDANELKRFLHSVKGLTSSPENLKNGSRTIRKALDRVAAQSGAFTLEAIGQFKDLDARFYYKSLAQHISQKKLPLKSLQLSEEEMLKVVRWVTYLDLSDSGNEEDCLFTDTLIINLLDHADHVRELIIRNSLFEGTAFDRPSCNRKLQKLKKLTVDNCPRFNKWIVKLPRLRILELINCASFNARMDGLSSLQRLTLKSCPAFNRTIGSLPLTKKMINVEDCPRMRYDDVNSFRMALVYDLKLLKVMFGKAGEGNQSEFIDLCIQIMEEDLTGGISWAFCSAINNLYGIKLPETTLSIFQERIPLFKALWEILELASLFNGNSDLEVIKAKFTCIKEGLNYLKVIRACVEYIPDLTSILIRNMKEEVVDDIKNLNLLDLPADRKVAILPLLNPDSIRELILTLDRRIIAPYLNVSIQHQNYHGNAVNMLAFVGENYLQNLTPQMKNNLLRPLKELMTKIPHATLALIASADPDLMLSYAFALDDLQMASVVPVISEDTLVKHLRKLPILTHREYLLFATTRQKEAYVEQDLFETPPSLQEWGQTISQTLNQENLESLKTTWEDIVKRTRMTAQTYQHAAQSLKLLLLNSSPSIEYEHKVSAYFDPKIRLANDVLESIKTTGAKIQELEAKVVGKVAIPEEFHDPITDEIMTDPHYHPSTRDYVLDLTTWRNLTTHPTTRAPLNLNELISDVDLKARLENYRNEHPED